MSKIKKGLALLMTMMIALSVTLTPVLADWTDPNGDGKITTLEEALSYAKENYNKPGVSQYLTDNINEAEAGIAGIAISDSVTMYVKSGTNENSFISKCNTSYKGTKVTEDTVAIGDGLGVSANTVAAAQSLSGFVPIVNIILGIVVVGITLALALYTSFDVCYIVFPVFRNRCEEKKSNGKKPSFVSDEAVYAVEKCSIADGKNPLTAYLSKRIGSYIFVSIILFMLLTGNITIITNIALKIVSYIMDVLATLA